MRVVRINICLLAFAWIAGSGLLRAESDTTPQSLLSDMLAAYEKVTTYSDTGTLITTSSSDPDNPLRTPLKTWFARPHYLRLEVLGPNDEPTVAWSDGQTYRVWDFGTKTTPGVVETVPRGKFLWGMHHYDIISLLEPRLSGRARLHQLSSAVLLPNESVEGVECFHLQGSLRGDRYEVWIAKSDRLVRKIKTWWQGYVFEEIHHDISIDRKIPMETFDFRPPENAEKR
jgi:outer membrane lipoprotein-sorting protein